MIRKIKTLYFSLGKKSAFKSFFRIPKGQIKAASGRKEEEKKRNFAKKDPTQNKYIRSNQRDLQNWLTVTRGKWMNNKEAFK